MFHAAGALPIKTNTVAPSVHQLSDLVLQLNGVLPPHVSLKNAELDWRRKPLQQFENLVAPLVITDIVSNDVIIHRSSADHERPISVDLAPDRFRQHPGLQFHRTAVRQFIAEDRMRDLFVHAVAVRLKKRLPAFFVQCTG